MAPLCLTVKTSPRESFSLEFEDDETVEALAVAIYSLRPELGEELRLAHKGRPLRDDVELRAAGIQSGDVIAVAKKPRRCSQAVESVPAAVASAKAATPHSTETQEAVEAFAPQGSAFLDKGPKSATDGAAAGTAATAAGSAATIGVSAPPPNETPVPSTGVAFPKAAVQPAAAPIAAAPTVALAVAPAAVPKEATPQAIDSASASSKPAVEAGLAAAEPLASQEDATKSAPTKAVPETAALATELSTAASTPTPDEVLPRAMSEEKPEEEVSSEVLLATAQRLESGDADAHPAELASLLRRTAARLQVFEVAVGEAGHALQMVNMLSAHTLRSMSDILQGLPPGHAQGSSGREESTKSYLIKKGDADIQEAHRQAALQRPSPQGSRASGNGGGMLSSSSTPMTKEEMDRARQARLEKLEAQQAEKKKEQEEAAARSKAKEAMFEKPFAGATKQLGKL
mmetsp:Transcript_6698/g.18370  ORF Transcript_6698/g.18370 Transcript_6698/m.18370 type:complete len:458 (-) Transcript_6698:267-1640(-)|eukprot:CAMPEP_0179057326 /NCGR_PEP_ID=MMETSP0796-20121207/24277_1 /TAXON_ID=73915 /ORGANISM="Pyrodinium bahamense, Strain pbaha01" /LENGTH=457 /DNA_ID=CAMNT_0020754043 /DNA_START=65 /DNA_END=1438 /DNA_ORIENTATION=-